MAARRKLNNRSTHSSIQFVLLLRSWL